MNTQTSIATPAPEASAAPSVMEAERCQNPTFCINYFGRWDEDSGEAVDEQWLVQGSFDADGFLCISDPIDGRVFRLGVEPKEIPLFSAWDAAGLDWDQERPLPEHGPLPHLLARQSRQTNPQPSDTPESAPGSLPYSPPPIPQFYRRVPGQKSGIGQNWFS